ncbi:MAG TPA: YHYH protein [Candidatus Obscuribacterales bacterium]
MRQPLYRLLCLLLIFCLSACQASGSVSQPAKVMSAVQSSVDLSRLPVGDGKLSSSAVRGSVFSCNTRFGNPPGGMAGGAMASGAWLHSDGSFDYKAKPTVDGEVVWPHNFKLEQSGDQRIVTSNDLPDHATGNYPIAASDDAYSFDRNPNAIKSQALRIELPLNPSLAAGASCLPMGAIGVLLSGSVFFNALDGGGRDAVAHEIQDRCQGHPERSGTYHYHNLSSCIADSGSGHSALLGYAFDGFGIYGHRGENGKQLSNADLDECHGHTHAVMWEGKLTEIYHYHATWEYPYTLGCFRGTPAKITGQQPVGPPPGGGPPPGPPPGFLPGPPGGL